MGLRAAIVGAGGVAQLHARAYELDPRVEEVWAVDIDQSAREGMARRFSKVGRTLASWEEAVGSEEVDFVDVCLPHHLHHPVAMAALRAGKDVVVEKPIALTLKQAEEMLSEAQRLGRKLFVSMNQLAYPAHIAAKRLIEEGAIGRPFLAVVNVYGNELPRLMDRGSWKGDWERAGGGALIDTGYHAIYVLQRLLGPARAVTARLPRLVVPHENKADDNACVILEFDGAVGNIVVSYTVTSMPWTEERSIFGTEGSLHIRDAEGGRLRLLRGGKEVPVEVETFPSAGELYAESIRRALSQFLDWVTEGREPDIRPEEAVEALRTALAAYESHRTGRRMEIRR